MAKVGSGSPPRKQPETFLLVHADVRLGLVFVAGQARVGD